MSNNTMVMICLLRSLSTIAAVVGAVFLAYNEKEGWGWMVFVALVLGSYSISTGGSNGE